MSNPFAQAAQQAAQLTDDQLAKELSSLGPLSNAQVKALLPSRKDQEDFIELMKVVEAETAMDQKLAFLRKNIQSAGKVALQALRFFVT